ncbi:MAG: cysteine hydrolase family protein [bacterium]
MSQKALIVIDVQNEYFPGGVWALPDAEKALPNILRLIGRAREAGEPVVFIQHVAPESSPVFAKGSSGAELHPEMPIAEGDKTLQKAHPSAFQDTGLNDWLQQAGMESLDVCGFMTQLCCDTTTRAAYEKGYKVRLFSDACAAREVSFNDAVIPHDVVHNTHLGTIARFAEVLPTDEM